MFTRYEILLAEARRDYGVPLTIEDVQALLWDEDMVWDIRREVAEPDEPVSQEG